MPEEDEEKPKEKRFTKEFMEKWSKTSEKDESPEEAILAKQAKLLEKDPKNIRVWFARGLLLSDMARNDEALECLDQVISLNPTYPGVWNARAEVLRRLGRTEEAADSLKKALEHVAPQVDATYKERIEKAGDIGDLVEPRKPKPPAPKRKGAREAAMEALGTLKDSGEDVPSAEPDQVEKEYNEKMRRWEREGYDVSPLKETLDKEPYKAKTMFFHFEQNVAKIKLLRETLDGITVPGFEKDIKKLREAMKAPYNIWKVEANMGELLSRVEKKEAELASKPKRAARKGVEPPVKDRRRYVAEPREKPGALRPAVGRVNGLTGVGRVNGLTGTGRVNGLAAAGRVNGLVNGLQSARVGLTNGLTDATGFTNGLASPRFNRDMKLRRWKIYLIPLIVTLLLMVPVFNVPLLPVPPPPGGVTIDGQPTDWSGVPGYYQDQDVEVDTVNITSYKILLKDGLLSILLQVKGLLFSDTTTPSSFYAFIDTDGDGSTGYDLGDLGSDILVELTGLDGSITKKSISSFDDANPGGHQNWSAWSSTGGVKAAFLGNTLEFQAPIQQLNSSHATFSSTDFKVVLMSDDNRGVTATTVAKMSAEHGALIVHQEAVSQVVAQGTTPDFFRMTFEAIDTQIHVNQVNLARSSQTTTVSTPSNFDVNPIQPFVSIVKVDTSNSAFGDFLMLEITSVETNYPVTILGNPGRAYVGAVPAGKNVEGIFADWLPGDLKNDVDNPKVRPSSLDIERFGTNRTGSNAYFYVDVGASILAGSDIVQVRGGVGQPSTSPPGAKVPPSLAKGDDIVRVYVDSNSTDGKGLPHLGLAGADYMVEVRGRHGRITEKSHYRWLNGGWQLGGAVEAANDARRLEIRFDLTGVSIQSMQVAFETTNWRSVVDTTDVSSVRSRTRGQDGSSTTYDGFYGVTLPDKLKADSWIKYTAGPYFLDWALPRELIQIDGEVSHSLAVISEADIETGRDNARYPRAYSPGAIDIQYLIEEFSLKEQFVIGEELVSTLTSDSGVVRFTFEMRMSKDLMVYIDGDANGDSVTTMGPISFMYGNIEHFSIPPATVWDATGNSINAPYTWAKSGPELSIDVPVSYFHTASYPVFVDPWVNYTVNDTNGPLRSATEQFGSSVAIGDFNADNVADLLVGAPANNLNGTANLAGAAYIYLGPLTQNKSNPTTNIPGTTANYKKGTAVAAGKFNGDSYWDALVTQYYQTTPSHIYYGRANWPTWLTSANVTINNPTLTTSRFGYAAAAANFDGAFYDDVVIGAPGHTNVNFQDGSSYVFLSPFPSTVTSANFTLLPMTNMSGQFGTSLAVGLLDSDTKYDIAVGEPIYVSQMGRVNIFLGSSLSSGSGNRMPNSNISGRQVGERFGWSVSIGKLNSDAYEDLAVGAPYNGLSNSRNGKVYLYLSSSTGITTNQAPSAEVTNQSASEQFGTAVLIGPFLGPNTYNLVVGAPAAAAGGTNRGSIYVFANPLSSSTPTKTLSGHFNSDQYGKVLAGGKFSSDNFYRIAIGNPNWVANSGAGRVVILYFIPEFEDVAIVLVGCLGMMLGLTYKRRHRKKR